ncbi:hypothetical protein MHYP_G00103930 [Metynnis hypsauchen]
MKAYLGETATFRCSYPEELKTNSKRLTNVNNQNSIKDIINTGKEAEKEQKDRFSIFDDRRSKVFSVNISDVREDDEGVYLCGVWRKENSVGYVSHFKEIQLQVIGNFTVLIRELSPQDSAVYRFGVGNEKHKDVELTVQSDSCCGGITKVNAHLGETVTFKCSYPDELKTNNKYLITLNNQNTVINTGKEAEKEQKDRFSIFDDRSSKVFSVNISDVREDDGGVYVCGVWRKENSVGYYCYFREIQLQVTGKSTVQPETPSTTMEPTTATTYWTTSTEPAAETSDEEHLKTPSTTMEPTTATTDRALIAAPAAETSDDHLQKSKALPENPSTATAPWTASSAPGAETSHDHLSSSAIITVCICGTLIGLLLIGGAAVIYKLRNHKMQDSASTGQLTEKNNDGDGDPHGNQYISMGPVYQSLDSNAN